METLLEKSQSMLLDRVWVSDGTPRREQWVWRVLRFARHSFALRAVIVMTLGTLMSCSSCNTCLAFATWIGCNTLSESTSTGCGSCGSDDEEEEEAPRLESICDDGVDEDEDGDVDCADIDCQRSGVCGEYYCYDGRDDDGDGAVDCDDEECCHYEWCRCHCEARCDDGATVCVSDEESCDYECCAAGQECVDGRCSGCETECSSGYVPCWTSDELCAHHCCTPGQECGESGCQCPMECGEGTNPCLIDEWTCTYACCEEGEVCRSGGCSPYACAAAEEVEGRHHELDLQWSELEDNIDISGVDGCIEGLGTEALLEVIVPPREAIMVEIESGWIGGIHVLDECPPTQCRSSVGNSPEGTTLWINSSTEEERVFVLLESGGQEAGSGQLYVSPLTGEACDAAIIVPSSSEGFSWFADAKLFDEWSEGDLCGVTGQRHLWFDVEIDIGEQLDVMAWGSGDEVQLSPSIAVIGGACGEPSCLVVGEDVVSLTNDLHRPQTLSVVIGWNVDFAGDVNVELVTE